MAQEQKPKTKKFEFDCLLQDINRKKKGSKSYKKPHTAITVLVREIDEDEMDALVRGGCFGVRVYLKIEVVMEKKNGTT